MAWLTARDGCRNNFADVTGIKLSFIFVYNPMTLTLPLKGREYDGWNTPANNLPNTIGPFPFKGKAGMGMGYKPRH